MLIVDSDQRRQSVTLDITGFVVLLYCWSCYSWSVRMCSKFKDTASCFHRCRFFLETPLQKGNGTWLFLKESSVLCMWIPSKKPNKEIKETFSVELDSEKNQTYLNRISKYKAMHFLEHILVNICADAWPSAAQWVISFDSYCPNGAMQILSNLLHVICID